MKRNQMLGLLLAAVVFCFLSAPSAILADGDFALNDDGTKLIKYNGNDSFVSVPDGVQVVGGSAFTGKKAVNTVYLPDSVTEIEGGAFENCSNLQNVIVSGNSKLSYIGAYAFAGCPQLNDSFAMGVKNVSQNAFNRKAEPTAVKDNSTADPGKASGKTTPRPDQTAGGKTPLQSAARSLTAPSAIGAWEQEDGSVLVIWAPVEDVVAYELYRSANGDEPVLLQKMTDNSYTDTDLNLSRNNYSYSVVAVIGSPEAGGTYRSEMSEAAPVERISQAQDGIEVNGIGYTITPDGLVVTAYRGNATELKIPSGLKIGNLTYKVIAIGPNVFRNNKTLRTITLPNTIQVIETGAFAYCNAMIDQ